MISSASNISNKLNLSEYTSGAVEGAELNAGDAGILDFLNLLQISSEGLPNTDAKTDILTALSGMNKEQLSKMNPKQIQDLLTSKVNAKDIPTAETSSKEISNLLELLTKNNKTAVKEDPSLKVQIKNGIAKQESLSSLDFPMNRMLVQPKAGMKEYLKAQDSKMIKLDSQNVLEKSELLSSNNEVSNKLLNEFNFGNSNASSTVDGNQKVEKNVIESLANQITQRINDINSAKPMQFNSESTIEINHAELGSLTLNVKRNQKDF